MFSIENTVHFLIQLKFHVLGLRFLQSQPQSSSGEWPLVPEYYSALGLTARPSVLMHDLLDQKQTCNTNQIIAHLITS